MRSKAPAFLWYLHQNPELGRLVGALQIGRCFSCRDICTRFRPDSDRSGKDPEQHVSRALASILRLTPNLMFLAWHLSPDDMTLDLANSLDTLTGLHALQLSNVIPYLYLWQTGWSAIAQAVPLMRTPHHITLLGFSLPLRTKLPGSVRSLTLYGCGLESSDGVSSSTASWTAPGLKYLSVHGVDHDFMSGLSERLSILAPQITKLDFCITHPPRDWFTSSQPTGFFGRFPHLTSLTISSVLAWEFWLEPLPPKLEYLECVNACMWRDEFADLIRREEERSPSLQRILWVYYKDCADLSDSRFRVQDELSVSLIMTCKRSATELMPVLQRLCRELGIEFACQIVGSDEQ